MAYRGADPTDVMGRRIGAYLLDGLLNAIVLAVILWPLFLSASTEIPGDVRGCASRRQAPPVGQVDTRPDYCIELGDTVRVIPRGEGGAFSVQLILVSVGLSVATGVLLQGLAGGTPGKLILGLRVVRKDGTFAGLGRCLVRTVLLPIDSACCAIVGLLTAFRSKGHRRVGDMVAGTMVIGRDDQVALMLARSGMALPDRKTIAAQAYAAQNPYAADPGPAGPVPFSGGQASPIPGSVGAAPAAGPVAGIDAPLWDDQRHAFIQYDPALGAWVQWDDASGQWGPIRT